MAQRDYVSRSRNSNKVRNNSGRKKNRKKKSGGVSITMVMVAFTLLLLFLSGLFYLKSSKTERVNNKTRSRENNIDKLPSKPETRWIYPEQLRNPHSTPLPVLPKNNEQDLSSNNILNEEQRLLLSQIQADMRHPDIALPGTYNQQVTPHTNISSDNNKSTEFPKNKQTVPLSENNKLPISPSIPKETTNGKIGWYLQCGAFRNTQQVDAVRAALALADISTKIERSGDWHRVILGPYTSKDQATKQLPLIESVGIKGCIFISPRG